MEARFLKYIEKDEDTSCWIWKGARNTKGYGQFWKDIKPELSHRVAYELWVKSIADGECVRHKCDDPSCCNPDHLEIGTQQDNMDDKVSRNRQARPKGELNGRAKLTEDDVRKIRMLLATGISGMELSKQFKISPTQISSIKKNQNWSNVR